MPDADRLDRLLIEAGERWRAGQPPAPPVDSVWRRPADQWSTRGGLLIVAAGLVVALTTIVLGTGGRPGPSPLSPPSRVVVAWDEAQIRAAEVRPGDTVTATGVFMARANEPAQLCTDAVSRLMFGVPPGCSGIAVPLGGSLDLSSAPGRTTEGDVTYAYGVRVVGRWTGTAIEDPVLTSAPSHGYEAPLPCPRPASGWASPSTSGAFRQALDPLAQEIADHPELYAGYYTLPVIESSPMVEVVRTTVDPRTIAARIGALFPYAVCLTHDYSQAEIDAAIFAFANGPISMPAVSGDSDRVGVQIAAVDDRTLPIFLAHPAAYPIPLVTKYDGVAAPDPSPTAQVEPPTITSNETAIPPSINGEAVVPAADAAPALAATPPGDSILVGGWLKPELVACPEMQTFPDIWNACFAIRLFDSPWGGDGLSIFLGSSGVTMPIVPDGEVEPVVLRVHSRDQGCPSSAYDCASLPVLDAAVWFGRVGPPSAPTSTQPPNGLPEPTARADAIAAAGVRSGGSVTVVSARSGRFAEVGPAGSADVAGDRWVWAVVVRGEFAVPDCRPPMSCPPPTASSLIVLDYVTGEVLLQETPAPSSPSDLAAEARTIATKFEEARAAGYWDVAWDFLSPLSQQAHGPKQAFIDNETAYNAAGGARFEVADPLPWPFDGLPSTQLFPPSIEADIAAVADVHRAFYVAVNHPDWHGTSARVRSYIVVSLSDTIWEIWIVI